MAAKRPGTHGSEMRAGRWTAASGRGSRACSSSTSVRAEHLPGHRASLVDLTVRVTEPLAEDRAAHVGSGVRRLAVGALRVPTGLRGGHAVAGGRVELVADPLDVDHADVAGRGAGIGTGDR